ncbi:MAG: hypothetical protein J5I50_11955 [Chitinophagaceae bacterium]|nr:hypothetical protein [Chitinophagaceae bacterium]
MKKNGIIQWIVIVLFALAAFPAQAQDNDNIQITRFELKVEKAKKVNINWATDNKVETNYFEVERSSDGENFKTVALVFGPDPQKPGDQYECFDKISGKKAYYRLKHVGLDGSLQYSSVKMINL